MVSLLVSHNLPPALPLRHGQRLAPYPCPHRKNGFLEEGRTSTQCCKSSRPDKQGGTIKVTCYITENTAERSVTHCFNAHGCKTVIMFFILLAIHPSPPHCAMNACPFLVEDHHSIPHLEPRRRASTTLCHRWGLGLSPTILLTILWCVVLSSRRWLKEGPTSWIQ